VGIQTHFVRLWQHLASRLAGRANVMGIDPFNEPYPGQGYPCSPFTACPPFETGALAEFYRRVIPAVRAGGARQVIYPEAIADSGVVAPSLPGFDDPQTGFHYHYYCNVTQTSTKVSPASARTPEGEACKQAENESLGNYHRYTRGLGVPAFLGEFSCNDVNDDNAQVVDDVGAAFDSWTIWAYYTAADDPADCPGQGLLVDDKKPAVAKAAKLDAIVVPHAQAIAGTPESTSLDRATRTFKLSYRAAAVPGATLASDVTKVFVPQRMYPTGYRAKVTGATVISAPTAPWLLLRSDAPGGEVTLTHMPATDSTTGRPLQTGSACASRRRIAVHLRRPRGFVPRAAVVRIGTRTRRARVRSAGRGRLVVVVDLRGLPRATTRVRVRVRGARGRSVGTTRTYRPCTTNRLVPSARSQPVR
jgi:endoglycosylceramidase